MKIFSAGRLPLLLVITLAVGLALRPFFTPDPRFVYSDDFFYYLVPAQHFLGHGNFVFFPDIITNGFHPLWMAVIVGLLALTHGVTTGFYLALNMLQAALAVATYLQARKLAHAMEASQKASIAAGLLAFSWVILIAMQGMEIALTIPLVLWLLHILVAEPLNHHTPRRWFGIGLLVAACVLSRLDCAVLLAPIGLFFLLHDRVPFRGWLWLMLGASPIVLYGVANIAWMDVSLPVSALAKQLRSVSWPGYGAFRKAMVDCGPAVFLLIVIQLLFSVTSLLARISSSDRVGLINALYLCGMILFFVVQSSLSDWQLWFWYFYPLAIGVVIVVAFLSRSLSSKQVTLLVIMAGCISVETFYVIAGHETYTNSWVWHNSGKAIPFIQTHPGRYAMGDRSGSVAARTASPVLQLEGLMGDATFLNLIRTQTPLREVLQHYHIDYYITTEPEINGNCFAFHEPAQAGPLSPVMRGNICKPPIFENREWPPIWIFRAIDVQ